VGFLEPLPDAALMRATDAWAIEEREIPALELMERAGEGLAQVVAQVAPHGRIVLVCGKGNNGGDGYVAARHLRSSGRDVDVLALPGEPSEDAAEMRRRLRGGVEAFSPERLAGAEIVVDAMLGTGFRGTPRDHLQAAIAALAGHRVVAVDVPSGVNASTGEVEGDAVHAVATATFHRSKPGLWINPGKSHAGEIRVLDIGIPDGAPGAAACGLIRPSVLDAIPHRGADATKFTSGAVVVVGGSPGLTGAPVLAALGAMRAGAGYVTLTGPVEPVQRPIEAMYTPDVDAAVGRADAVVLGPGLSKADDAFALARGLASRIQAPLVVDADGLNALAGQLAAHLGDREAPTVLTPHAGELARLLGRESADVSAHRLACAREAAEASGAIVVLKGDDTLVVEPGGRVGVSPGIAPALATAGTGDVLAGVIGALLAKGMTPFDAACAGVFAHARAGQLAAEPHGPDGIIATDVATALPAALRR
jgi:NAD(P)H-hydrate epimerase